ncbi:hypothetical protein GF324_02265, partial [bacterium]|nr:hypothetical protein [bacterium]
MPLQPQEVQPQHTKWACLPFASFSLRPKWSRHPQRTEPPPRSQAGESRETSYLSCPAVHRVLVCVLSSCFVSRMRSLWTDPVTVDAFAMSDSLRLDHYLFRARLFKSRSQATSACKEGRILVDDMPAKAASDVQAGQVLKIRHKGL